MSPTERPRPRALLVVLALADLVVVVFLAWTVFGDEDHLPRWLAVAGLAASVILLAELAVTTGRRLRRRRGGTSL